MALTDINVALLETKPALGERLIVKTARDGFSGIFNQHTFEVRTTGTKIEILQDGLDEAPVLVADTATNTIHSVSNTNIDRYNPAKVRVIKPKDLSLEVAILTAFKDFAFDEFTFPEYNVCVETIHISTKATEDAPKEDETPKGDGASTGGETSEGDGSADGK